MLEIKGVSKSFPGVRALHDVSFEVGAGEVHALVGENGAGKSTLMKVLSGVYASFGGEVLWEGRALRLRNPGEAAQRGIAIIHQELNLIPELTIAENLFLGREPRTRLGTLDRARMEREAGEWLARLSLELPPQRLAKYLRVGEQQLVEIARALSLEARLLMLDEPTSALSEAEIEHLFGVIESLKGQGVTMIYISHKLDEVFRLCERITVLRDGEHVATLSAAATSRAELIRLMVGRSMGELFPKAHAAVGEEVLRVEGLSLEAAQPQGHQARGRALHEISFSLRRGEIVGVAGLMGAGRTELLEALFGVYTPRRVRGRVWIAGRERLPRTPREAIAAGLALATEDRKGQSLLLNLSVAHNSTLAALRQFLSLGFVRARAEREAVAGSMSRLQVRAASAQVAVGTLSGGNQQKVVLAKCLMTAPQVLLLDEPTRGIDVGAKAEIYALMSRLAGGGTAILMASSELPELLAMCDRVLVLCEGRLSAELSREQATPERILEAATARQQQREQQEHPQEQAA